MKPKPKRLTLEQAAEWLDMTPRTLGDRIRAKEITVIRDGKRILIEESEVEAYDRRRRHVATT